MNNYSNRYKNSEFRKPYAKQLLRAGFKQKQVAYMTGYSQQEISRLKRSMQ